MERQEPQLKQRQRGAGGGPGAGSGLPKLPAANDDGPRVPDVSIPDAGDLLARLRFEYLRRERQLPSPSAEPTQGALQEPNEASSQPEPLLPDTVEG